MSETGTEKFFVDAESLKNQLNKMLKEAETKGFKNGIRYATYIAKRQHLHNNYQAKNYPSYHTCADHQCYGCRADEAITIQTLLELEVDRKEVHGEETPV